MRTRNYKADLEELEDGYEDARNEAFNEQLLDMFFNNVTKGYYNKEHTYVPCDTITEDDIQGFIDSFTFPEVGDWCAAEFESRRDSYEDAKYEEMKDERMGL